jgi:hypothetical protein
MSAFSPACHADVPAESTSISPANPFSLITDLKIASAAGDLQILPRQTKSILNFTIKIFPKIKIRKKDC